MTEPVTCQEDKSISYSLDSLDRVCNFYEQQFKTLLTTKCIGTIGTDHNVPPERGLRFEITFRVRGSLLLANVGNEFTVLISVFGSTDNCRSLTLIKPYIPVTNVIANARHGVSGSYEKYTQLKCPLTLRNICTLDYVNSLELEISRYMQIPHTFLPLNGKGTNK